ncbi:uncharacterized protein LOC107745439 [Sinocyclocheilus rhinocerous]|uniref:uncharacterized protein LOC107745439 n=1 Tax=Sinocyclocheilus rhinocerous TaxID=307959 RepID=UPI0007BA3455|nr:PREDICTED: uncharacterized protein LOC107745439 [Sinocyclocheilus rhinocerous]
MCFRITRPATWQERAARFKALTGLRQEGGDAGAFAQLFWNYSVGLGFNDGALKDFFNGCLDDPLSHWEMKGLETLNFWDFTWYLVQRVQWVKPGQQEPFVGILLPVLALLRLLRRGGRDGRGRSSPVVLEDPMWVVSEIATETTLVVEWLESTSEPAPVQEQSESPPDSAPVCESSESILEPAPVQERTESSPEFTPVDERPESTPEPVPIQERTESTPVQE